MTAFRTASMPMSRRRFGALAGGAGLAFLAAATGGTLAHEGHDHGSGHGGATPEATREASPMAGHGGDVSTGAVYLTIRNDGDEGDRLVGGTTAMAEHVEVHEMRTEDNVGIMRHLEDGLEIPAGETVVLEPNGYHLMLIGLTESLLPDTAYALTLRFERAGEVTLTVPVQRHAPAENEQGEPVTAGDLAITGAWSRPAPKLDGAASPAASPAAARDTRRG